MKIFFQLGGIRILLDSERRLEIDDMMLEFLLPDDTSPDVVFELSWDYENAELPTSPCIGEDELLEHYREGDRYFCLTKGAREEYVAATVYKPDFSYVRCFINEKPFVRTATNLASIMRLYPLFALFKHFGVLFFHAAQVEYRGRGLVFTAPSGTGKTTHSRIWAENRDARLLCNDRTLLRKTEEGWLTYGFPIDGSEPISSGERAKLGAVVLLSQAPQNKVERLPLFKMAARLMPQLLFDSWDQEARVFAMNSLIELLADLPVYHFGCTPDPSAVDCLEEQLISDGVFENG